MDEAPVRKNPTLPNKKDQAFTIYHKLIPLLILTIGIGITTQYAARLCGYSPDLPGVWFYHDAIPVYYPWMYIFWVLKFIYWEPVHPYFQKAGYVLLGFGIGSIVIYFFLSLSRGLLTKFNNLYGTARWATKEDLYQNGLLGPHGVVLGQLASANVSMRVKKNKREFVQLSTAQVICASGETSTLLLAPSRSGKGVSTIIPTLLNWPGSTIVFDPKGENWQITAGYRRTHGNHVLRFSPTHENSIHYNPIAEIRPGIYAPRDADVIADILISPSGQEVKTGDVSDHFNTLARGLLKGIILYVYACPEVENKSLGGVLDVLSGVQFVSESTSDEQKDDITVFFLKKLIQFGRRARDQIIGNVILSVALEHMQKDARERSGVFSTAVKTLQIFHDPLLRRNTSDSDFSVMDFVTSEHPISLYITVPYSDIKQYSSVLRLFLVFMIKRLSEEETRHNAIRLNNRLLFLLDEFPTLGNFPALEENMGVLPGYGVTFLIVCQTLEQLIKIYGQHHPFLAHCKTWVIFAPGDLNSAKSISEIIGKETVWKESVSTSGDKFSVGMKNMNVSGSEVERNLINADEVLRLPQNHCLIIQHGMNPYLAKKIIYYLDPRFNVRTNLPVPETREELMKELPRRLAKKNTQQIKATKTENSEHTEELSYTNETSILSSLDPADLPPETFEGEVIDATKKDPNVIRLTVSQHLL